MKGVFIAGTGTDVGKTIVAAGVLRALLTAGIDATAMKPVQTGAWAEASGKLRTPDLEFVLGATGLLPDEQTRELMAPWLFEPACSPHLAARLAGQTIGLERILDSARQLAARHEFLVVEGAGGLLVPLGARLLLIDVAAALGLPVLLVGPAGLGAINHVLLSLEALRARGLPVAGVVLNATGPVSAEEAFIHEDNATTIAQLGQVRVLARIPWLGVPPDLELLDQAVAAGELLKELQP
jgi:dethiobiotin synthase